MCVNSGKPSYHHDQHTERAVRGEVRRDGLMRLSRCRFQVMLEMIEQYKRPSVAALESGAGGGEEMVDNRKVCLSWER